MVKASSACAPAVARTEIAIQTIFLPVLSIKKPEIGDAIPEIKYKMLLIVLAFAGL